MGLASGNQVGERLQLCVFDLRRGQLEGQELDKILFFYPQDLPFATQLSVIGLSEGLITFTRMFSPEEACEIIEAEKHSHVFYEAETDIWMVMVVDKHNESQWRFDALRKVLKEIHSLFMMFHGTMRAMLEREPNGALVRSHLHAFIVNYLGDVLVGKKLLLPSFSDSLKERGTVQMLSVGRDAAFEIQSLARVLESCAGVSHCFSMILFQDLLISTTLSPEDTINLFTYAIQRLTPQALSTGTSSWSYLRKGSGSIHATGGITSSSSDLSAQDVLNSRDTTSNNPINNDVTRPLQRGGWSKGKDGFLITDIWGSDPGSLNFATPTIWLRQTGEKMYLCVYQFKFLTSILLFPVSSVPNGEQGISFVKKQILGSEASHKMLKVEEKLTRGWGGHNAYHVSGYRYLLIDNDRNVSRASPPEKVATLTKESLLAMSKLREEVDLEKSRNKDNGAYDKELEICIRVKNNAWVIARSTRGKDLYIVLEKANETLLYASDAVEKFNVRYCGGTFST